MSRGWIILCHFCRCGCGCGVRGDLEIRHRSVLVDLECSDDVTHTFLWSHSRSTRARSSPSFVPLADFKLSLRPRDTIGELSRGVRGVVFVFDLLLNFKFVFSYLDTFGHHPLGQRPSLGLRLRIRLWMRRRCVSTFHFFIWAPKSFACINQPLSLVMQYLENLGSSSRRKLKVSYLALPDLHVWQRQVETETTH